MDTNLVQQVTIVGGGTAGWLTAAILNAKLNPPKAPRRVEIVLIESPTIPTVGVGEGTLPAMGQVLREIGVDEREFMKACNASFKYGVRFEGWNRDEQGRECSFMHPFASPGILDEVGAINYFLAFGPQPGRARRDVADSLCLGPEFIALHRAPRSFGAAPYSYKPGARYSYHFDAGKLAEFMRDFAVKRGVIHLLDDVDDATLNEKGHIKELRLRRTGVRPVELVVDCTGFQGLLLGKVLNEPFLPYANHLLCDRAIPIQIPHADGAPLKVCTTARAMTAGWIWKVPLYSRIGTGYVFSSQFQSDDEALREICSHIGADPEKVNSRVIRMRVGRVRRAWVGNCIAVGLSGGFIEPLEATAIQTIIIAAQHLVKNFPTRPIPQPLVDRFNRRIDQAYESIRDFITMHYYASNREEPFWRAARAPSVLSETLKQNLELWRHRLPDPDDIAAGLLVTEFSYSICLASKGYFQGMDVVRRAAPPRATWEGYRKMLESKLAEVPKLPTAREFLRQLHGESQSQDQYKVYDKPPRAEVRASS